MSDGGARTGSASGTSTSTGRREAVRAREPREPDGEGAWGGARRGHAGRCGVRGGPELSARRRGAVAGGRWPGRGASPRTGALTRTGRGGQRCSALLRVTVAGEDRWPDKRMAGWPEPVRSVVAPCGYFLPVRSVLGGREADRWRPECGECSRFWFFLGRMGSADRQGVSV
ncbi:hypothetical protein STTU_3809 [Streptomyces sp. Tu6071]|nr:hypothetical protein STTU_3809 [Streptomyces sp. Tu6071]